VCSPDWKQRTGASFLVSVGDAVVAVEVVRQLPAPVILPRNLQRWPPVDPHLVIPDLPITDKACDYCVGALMATPHSVMRVCAVVAIRVEVAPHRRTSVLP